MQDIRLIGKKLNLSENDLFCYGKDYAKVEKTKGDKNGKLILVTSINPTSQGEGKTTVAIGLADAFSMQNKSVCLSLREPSLGPVFGLKGGATGGGKSSLVPEEEINLHFTGDFHAITYANNLLCSLIDNHIFQGNKLAINPNKIMIKRCVDLCDRSLRNVKISADEKNERNENFVITPATEMMSILTLSTSESDLKKRLSNILIGVDKNDKPLFVKDLKCENALLQLLKTALKPNLVQTKYGTPALVHCGPFANVSFGTSSVMSIKTALNHADFVITEAGFGADCGGEKFLDFVCQTTKISPYVVLVVATIKALKLHSENGEIEEGFKNLEKHILNLKNVFNKKVVVVLNKFKTDKKEEEEKVISLCQNLGVKCYVSSPFLQGGESMKTLADDLATLSLEKTKKQTYAYSFKESLSTKIENIVTKVYGGKNVVFTKKAQEKIKLFGSLLKDKPVIIAKTPFSLSGDKNLVGVPKDFTITVKDVDLFNGGGYVVAKANSILLMPGMGENPNAIDFKSV